ncbi:hypothetical protein U9M48_005588, partial [Paspalum notatum var. saurae]
PAAPRARALSLSANHVDRPQLLRIGLDGELEHRRQSASEGQRVVVVVNVPHLEPVRVVGSPPVEPVMDKDAVLGVVVIYEMHLHVIFGLVAQHRLVDLVRDGRPLPSATLTGGVHGVVCY